MKKKQMELIKYLSSQSRPTNSNEPVFRGLHHECLEAILRKSRDYPVFIVVFCTLNLFYFFYLFDIIMV